LEAHYRPEEDNENGCQSGVDEGVEGQKDISWNSGHPDVASSVNI
jgi:hypothetical protein